MDWLIAIYAVGGHIFTTADNQWILLVTAVFHLPVSLANRSVRGRTVNPRFLYNECHR